MARDEPAAFTQRMRKPWSSRWNRFVYRWRIVNEIYVTTLIKSRWLVVSWWHVALETLCHQRCRRGACLPRIADDPQRNQRDRCPATHDVMSAHIRLFGRMIQQVSATFRDLLMRDHARLDALLAAALDDASVEVTAYSEFRSGLLRHIGIEERILFPEIRARGGSTEVERQLHRDHAALAALLILPPARAPIEQIREILRLHNPLEEGEGGFYRRMEVLADDQIESLNARVLAYPEVRTAPYSDTAVLRRSIDTLLREAQAGRQLLTEISRRR